jgi:5-methylcytosine-specific restriction endonuclease McrA
VSEFQPVWFKGPEMGQCILLDADEVKEICDKYPRCFYCNYEFTANKHKQRFLFVGQDERPEYWPFEILRTCKRCALQKYMFCLSHKELYDKKKIARRDRRREYKSHKDDRYNKRIYNILNRKNYNKNRIIGVEEIRETLYFENPFCHYCDKELSRTDKTLDHKVPKSQGGDTSYENCVLACRKCNKEKNCMSYEDYWKLLVKTSALLAAFLFNLS